MSTNAARNTTTREAGRFGRFVRFDRRLLAGLVAVVAAAAVTQAARAEHPAPVVPGKVQVPAGNKVFLVGQAVGVQIYACNGLAWSFVAPRADLFGDTGQLIVTHFGGPSWQAKDGSAVVGTVVDRVTVDATAIPWLLLSASPAPGSHRGRLGHTTFIQRVATTGGVAPAASECNASTAGTRADVPYTADYFFWK